MAKCYPFSQKTVALLQAAPPPGKTHHWLARVAGGLRHVCDAETCFKFLRFCCDRFVHHRVVPDREISAAVDFVYNSSVGPAVKPYDWPAPDPALIERALAEVTPCFDVDIDTGLSARDVLPRLFRPGELVCAGHRSETALIRPLEDCLADAHFQQYIVVNPMRTTQGINKGGIPSSRCQSIVGPRRYLVAEFDDKTKTKAQQSKFVTRLAQLAPLVLVVDSGGKSLHAWFRVDGMPLRDQARFFAAACLLGADPSRWDTSGWLRMPGGLRIADGSPSIRQRILYAHDHHAH
jgi:hypothetical protein